MIHGADILTKRPQRKMGEFLFFPPSSITQINEKMFELVNIYGGKFYLGFPHIEVFLAQGSKIDDKPEKTNLPEANYNAILNQLLKKKIIYPSKFEKDLPFNKRRVLEQLTSKDAPNYPRTLNIGEITLELIQTCPYHCEGCFREANSNELTPLSKLEELLNELSKMGLSKLSLSGGEITSSKKAFERFQRIASYAKSVGIEKIRLLTTGYDPERVNEAIDYIDEIQISIDGLKQMHDTYKRFKGAFERAIESLKICERKNVKVTTNTVVSKLNIGQVPDLIEFLLQFKIDTIRITKIMSPKENLRLNTKEAKKLYEIVKEKQKKCAPNRIINAYGGCTDILNCTGGIVYAHITASGNVLACDYDVDNPAGNINHSDFQEIWTNSPIIQKYRMITPITGKCLECRSRVFCFGNCKIDKEYVDKIGVCENENR